jgi:hypothetical protein
MRCLLGLIALVLSTSSHATNVQPLGPSQAGMRFGIDRDSIEVDEPDAQAIILIDLSSRPDGETTLKRQTWRFHCNERRVTVLEETRVGALGAVLSTQSVAANRAIYRDVVPGTYTELAMWAICPPEDGIDVQNEISPEPQGSNGGEALN